MNTLSLRLAHGACRPNRPAQLFQQIRSIFIQTSSTPNPEALKFEPTGVTVLEDKDNTGNGFFVSRSDDKMEILRSPLAKKLFDLEGVKSVYLGTDFVTVTKFAEHKWKFIRPEVYDVIMEWADSGEPALTDEAIITDTTILDDDNEIVAMIKELIETKIRPAVHQDGGDIRYVDFDEDTGIVTVQLAGSCVGCPSSSVTLKQGVENMLKHYIHEVKTVVALEESPPEDSNATEEPKQQKTYEERLAAAGIPFSD
jgi:NFU1 iron-sulfur cluster scaffold homolog, mitochondrial